MRRRSPITALLVPSGLLAGHAVSAAITHSLGLAPRALPHPVIELLGSIAIPLAAIAAFRLFTTAPGFSGTRLAVYQACSYAALVGGHAVTHGGGLEDLVHDPVIGIGIAGQLLGALLLSLLTTTVIEFHGRRPHARLRRPITSLCSPHHDASTLARTRVVDAVIRRRGPPGRTSLLPSRS